MSEQHVTEPDIEAFARQMAAELDVPLSRAIQATRALLTGGYIELRPTALSPKES